MCAVVQFHTGASDWSTTAGDETGFGFAADHDAHRYLILNYEAFQQPDSAERVRSLTAGEPIDFVIVDEIHYAKQRAEDISQRRRLVAALTTLAAERNADLHVLGMSATPVINNLHEIEATGRFTDRNAFGKALEALGFAMLSVEDKWKFTHIRAIKTERPPREGVEPRF